MRVDLPKAHDPDEIELLLRKSGKDCCVMCGQSISGREVSLERLEQWLRGKEKPMCRRCRLIATRRKMLLIFMATALIPFLAYLLVEFF